MSDNINENGQFNPYVKKEDVGAANASSPAENPAVGNHAANGASAAGGAAEAPAENAAFANSAAENPSSVSNTAADANAASGATYADAGTQGGISGDGQYSIVHPRDASTYIPPRSEAQPQSGAQGFAANNTAQNPQNGGASASGAPQGSPSPYTMYNGGAYGAQPSYGQPPYGQTPYGQTPPANSGKPKHEKKRGGASVGVIALVCALCVVLSGAAGFAGAYASLSLKGSGGNISSYNGDTAVIYRSVSTDSEAGQEATVTDVVNAVADSVVEITTEYQTMGLFQYVTSGAGSGVIISENGYIVTNNHVITSDSKVADSVKVRLANGDEYDATVVGRDSESDIAVIKIDADELTAAVFSDSDSLTVGQDVVAIGNPLGELGGTVTEGIISALDREVNVDGNTMNLLQTSAAVSPGNSGGGLFNMKGELVGIVNAKSSGSGVEGLGFAIPSNDACRIAEELMTNGYVTGKPYVGITLYYASDAYTAYRYFKSQVPGLYISETVEGYNDDVLEYGDRIIAVNGNEVSAVDDVKNYIKECNIGDKLTFSIYRDGKLTEVEVTCYEYVPEKSAVSFE